MNVNARPFAVIDSALDNSIADATLTVDAHISSFRELVNSIPISTQATNRYRYQKCSLCNSSLHNKRKCPLRNVEAQPPQHGASELPQTLPTAGSRHVTCSNCKLQGHYKRTCPHPLAPTPLAVPCRACSNCGLQGHFKPKCPYPPNSRV